MPLKQFHKISHFGETMNKQTRSSDTSSTHSESSDSESFDFVIEDHVAEPSDLEFLLSYNGAESATIQKIIQLLMASPSAIIRSGELILGVLSYVEYDKMKSCLNNKIVKVFEEKKTQSKQEVTVLFQQRMCNIPLTMVLAAYRQLDVPKTPLLVLVPMMQCKEESIDQIRKNFPEIKKYSYKQAPLRPEDIFFFKNEPLTTYSENGSMFVVFLLGLKELEVFLEDFRNEVEK